MMCDLKIFATLLRERTRNGRPIVAVRGEAAGSYTGPLRLSAKRTWLWIQQAGEQISEAIVTALGQMSQKR
jgi:hypothetical protein